MNRKAFIADLTIFSCGACLPARGAGFFSESVFEDRRRMKLKPIGRALELEGYYVWCNSPILGEDGKVHVFFSRWKAEKKMSGWINGSEIVHAVCDAPEKPFTVLETVLAPRPGYWDATTCHNPLIKKVDGKYLLFYMGNSNGKTNTKRIGLALADSLYGPWKRPDQPLLMPGPAGAWDDHCTTNPAFIKHPNGEYWMFYKSWNTREYETSTDPLIRGNRKYGLAIAKNPEGPYEKYTSNPVIDFSGLGNNRQFEDAFVWLDKNKFRMIARDMGFYNHEAGILMRSSDGIEWSKPEIAYEGASKYIQQPPAPDHLKKYGRFERPQVLLINDKPAYLFTASQGGKYMTSSSFIFQIE